MNVLIKSFWNTVIDGYYIHDITALESIKPSSQGFGYCSVPQFLCVCSTLELLAKLLRDGEKFNPQDHPGAWKYYFDNYLPDYKVLVDPIHDLGRNGSAHLLLPRHIGIAKNTDSNEIFFVREDRPVLNVSKFTKLFTESLEKVKQDLNTKDNLQERFLKRLGEISMFGEDLYNSRYKSVIDAYIATLPATQPNFTSSYSSPHTTLQQSYPAQVPVLGSNDI